MPLMDGYHQLSARIMKSIIWDEPDDFVEYQAVPLMEMRIVIVTEGKSVFS